MGNVLPTIVIIDDSAEVRSLIRTRLKLSGRISVVDDGVDGTDAIRLADRHKPSLILLDTSMPGMDGLEALPGILTASPETRVVIYSGFDEDGLGARARELGAVAFIEKSLPINLLADELLSVLDSVNHRAETDDDAMSAGPRALTLVPDARDEVADASGHEDQTLLDNHLERFREVFEEAAIGMATMTLTGSIVRANRALGELMLCRREELVGVDYGRLTCGQGELLDIALENINGRGANLVHIEHDVAGASEPRRVRVSLAPVRDSEGQALYVFLQVQDITAQRAAEDQLRRSEGHFRLLVEAVEDYAIFLLSPEGIVVSWNAGAQRSKGYRAQDILGKHFRIFYTPDKQNANHPEYELESALRNGRYQEEGWRVRQDGTQFWANVTISAIFDESGQHLGFGKVTRDVTERRLADQKRDDAEAELAEANASLDSLNRRLARAIEDQSQFLAVTAHELRNPAAVLGGSAQTLANHWHELTADERERLLGGMTDSAVRLHRLLSDLLTVSSLESKSLRLAVVPSQLSGILETAVNAMSATDPDAKIIIEPHAEIDLQADPLRLAQAVDNLLINALAHGSPPIFIQAVVEDTMAVIRFVDSGAGVDAALQPKLFERFTAGDNVMSTGLGLFIVRELARAHGGDAYYEQPSPERPAGAFVLCIPLA